MQRGALDDRRDSPDGQADRGCRATSQLFSPVYIALAAARSSPRDSRFITRYRRDVAT